MREGHHSNKYRFSSRSVAARQDVFYRQAAKVIRAYSRVHLMDFMPAENRLHLIQCIFPRYQ